MRTYTGEQIPILGIIETHAGYKDQTHDLSLTVVEKNGPTLLGQDWLEFFIFDWKEIFSIKPGRLEEILAKYEEIFLDELVHFVE